LWLCDAETFYALNSIIYVGKGTVLPNQKVTAKSVTLHLIKPYLNTGRHLTGKSCNNFQFLHDYISLFFYIGDNWFSSLELAHELKQQGISYIGTIRHNNRGVPPDARPIKGRTRKDTQVYYDGIFLG